MKPLVTCLVGLVLSGLDAPVHARDYDLDPERWNGLGYFLTTAAEARVTLAQGDVVDLSELAPEDVLVLLYPTAPLPVSDLLAFVETGGYVIVADDHGSAQALLRPLGITRRDAGPTTPQRLWEAQDGFPIVAPAGEHFLFFNVTEVVANYPAALGIDESRAGLQPLLSFQGGREHFAIEASLGSGRALAIADPSIFLNDMLHRFYGDKQFVANVLRLYCQREPCRARLVRPGATWSGHFDADRARQGSRVKQLEVRVTELNQALAELSAALAEAPWALALAGLALLFVILLSARVRAREHGQVMRLLPSVPSQASSPALDDARGLVAQRHEADFSHLALKLGELSLERWHRADIAAFLATLPDAAQREQLQAALLRVSAETASLRSPQPPIWSAARFLRLHEDVQLLGRSCLDAPRGRRKARA